MFELKSKLGNFRTEDMKNMEKKKKKSQQHEYITHALYTWKDDIVLKENMVENYTKAAIK